MKHSKKNKNEINKNKELMQLPEIIKTIYEYGKTETFDGWDEEKLEAVYALGYYEYMQGKYVEASNKFQIILINDQLNRRAIKAFGSCLQMLNLYEDAMKQLAYAVYMEPSDPGPSLQIAECMLALNRKENAIEILNNLKKEFGSIFEHAAINKKVCVLLELLKK